MDYKELKTKIEALGYEVTITPHGKVTATNKMDGDITCKSSISSLFRTIVIQSLSDTQNELDKGV